MKIIRKITIPLIVLIILAMPIWAQEDDDLVSIGAYRKLHSNVLNEDRILLVNLPEGYNETTNSYPVLYILYGGQAEGYFAEAVHIVARLNEASKIPDMIIIGVKNTDRYRDYLPINRNGQPGGADYFLKFFTEELIPFVDQSYRTKDFRILLGPQAGATFCIYALMENPRLFRVNIITNPFWIHTNREYMLTKAKDFFNQEGSLNNFLFITGNTNVDNNATMEYLQQFKTIVEKGNKNDFTLIVNQLEKRESNIISSPRLRKGLETYFKDYKFPQDFQIKGLEDLKEYYQNLSQEYGYDVDIPEFTLVRQGDKLDERGKLNEAKVVFEYIVEKYPHDLNSYAGLADLHRRWGNYDLAIKYYEQLLKRSRMPFIERRLNSLKKYLNSPCLTSNVTLDINSLESILLRTDKILENPDAFWGNDGAYNLAKKWHDINQIPLDTLNYYNTWIDHLEELSNHSETQKQNHPSFRLMNEILKRKKVFDERALLHICSFLPKNNVNLNTTIYLTGHTLPWAFMTHGKIVINVLHTHYQGTCADDFMNTIVHEVFHIGYGKNRSYRTEIELENFDIYDILDSFHNEGMAVYTAYKAQEFFPAPKEKDYILLEDPKEVNRLLNKLNNFFSKADSLPEDSLKQKAWNLGVSQRAYYVVGSFMAKTIDEKAGREALIETIEKGPMSFVSTYNKLVEPEMQVYEFKLPDTLSTYQSLKQAILNNDITLFNDVKKEIAESDVSTDFEGKLNSLGYNMLHSQENEWAIRVFALNVDLFPESANAYDSLGEVYMKAGDNEKAIKNYKKSIELNPENDNAKQMLKELK